MDKCEFLPSGEKVFSSPDVFKIGTDSFFLADFVRAGKSMRVIDLGAGTGVLGLALSKRVKSCLLVDNSEAAYTLINKNIALNGLSERYSAMLCDVSKLPAELNDAFDIAVTNPPYYEDGSGKMPATKEMAAARHGDFKSFITAAAKVIKYGGLLFAVCPAQRLFEFSEISSDAGLAIKRIRFIKKDSKSSPHAVLIEAKKGARQGVITEPDIITKEL